MNKTKNQSKIRSFSKLNDLGVVNLDGEYNKY